MRTSRRSKDTDRRSPDKSFHRECRLQTERRRIATWQGKCEYVEDVVRAMALSRHGRRDATAGLDQTSALTRKPITPHCQGDKIMELGIYSFADVQPDPNSGALGSTADAMRNLR